MAASFSIPPTAIEAGVRMVEQGAGIIDVGGESTRPGAAIVDDAEERRRVIPVIEGLAGRVDGADFHGHLQGRDGRRSACRGRVHRQRHQRSALRAGAGRRRGPARRRDRPDAHARPVARHVSAGVLRRRRRGGARRAAREHGVCHRRRRRARIASSSIRGLDSRRRRLTASRRSRASTNSASLDGPLVVGPSRKSFLARALGARVPAASNVTGRRRRRSRLRCSPAHISSASMPSSEMLQVARVADEIRRYHRVDS